MDNKNERSCPLRFNGLRGQYGNFFKRGLTSRTMLRKPLLIVSVVLLLGANCVAPPQTANSVQPQTTAIEKRVNTVLLNTEKHVQQKVNLNTDSAPTITNKPTQTTKSTSVPYAPNGTYKNVDGNEIPSPYQAPNAPVGATAKCRDGSYSFSQHRSGTCSHHGGVADWL